MYVEVIGKKPLRYGGRKYSRGEVVEMSRARAKVFIAVGLVSDKLSPSVAIETRSISAEQDSEPQGDESAEATEATEATEVSGVEEQVPDSAAQEAPKPKRQYRRRDLTAEA